MTSNMTTAERRWESEYAVTSDWHPFRTWRVEAESGIEARMLLAAQLGLTVEELCATPAGGATK